MAQWRIKEISDLTKISVRMLHHYDKIGLLKPSVRSSNGYRWYAEADLARLQQIIALKFFGFSLSQIKTMLQKQKDLHEHLLVQQQMLEEQTEHLRQAKDALTVVLERHTPSTPFDWNDLITLIERYHMVEELKNTWADKLNDKQKGCYIKFRRAYPKEVTTWETAVEAINAGKLGTPEGSDGQRVVEAFSNMRKAQDTWEAATKNTKKMTKADAQEVLDTVKQFKANEIPLSPEGNIWFAKALAANRLQRWNSLHQDIIKQIETDPEGEDGKKLAKLWRDLIADHCIGGGPNDFHFGIMLLMDTARGKVELQAENFPELMEQNKLKTQKMADDIKMLQDPRAIDWIFRALKSH